MAAAIGEAAAAAVGTREERALEGRGWRPWRRGRQRRECGWRSVTVTEGEAELLASRWHAKAVLGSGDAINVVVAHVALGGRGTAVDGVCEALRLADATRLTARSFA